VETEAATRVVSDIWTAPDAGTRIASSEPAPRRRWLVPLLAVVTALALAAAVLSFTLPWGTPDGQERSRSDPVAGRDLQIDGIKLHVEVASLTRKGQGVTLQWSVRNADTRNWNPWTAFGLEPPSDLHYNSTAGVMLVDPLTGKKFGSAIDGHTCSCSPTAGDLQPGDTSHYYSVFAGVPESVERLSVQIPSVGLFADVLIS
jgi:hypothetical protein